MIGLAWVSGMCHRDYSCTINEGNNYESVFVIAHEMGHKSAESLCFIFTLSLLIN